MMDIIIQLIGVAVLGNMVAHWFGPIQVVKDLIKLEKIRFGWVLNCSKCMSFWLGVAIFQNIYLAAVTSLLGWSINWYLDIIDNWYEK